MITRRIHHHHQGGQQQARWLILRTFSLWSMKKEPELESALSRNRRWVVNNQIKNIILRYPNNEIPIQTLQKKFKTLDLQGKALNWLYKYPCCFEVHDHRCRLTKRMMNLVAEEQSLIDSQEPLFVRRLAKLLMLTLRKRLSVLKINEFKRNFGFPDDYIIRIVPKYPNLFRIVNETGRRSSMVVELLHWDPDFAVSAVEASSKKLGTLPRFSCSLPSSWVKSWERFREFDSIPYISPYLDPGGLVEGSKEMEKRNVGLVHELLSLTLWKKASIVKLGHFRREFVLPDKLNVLLLKHPGIFYVSNKYQIYTVLLREAYVGSQLVDKDPLVLVKEKFGELMQEGLHEYNQRRRHLNVEKRRKKGIPLIRVDDVKGKRRRHEVSDDDDDDDDGDKLGGLFDPEERKRLDINSALLVSKGDFIPHFLKMNWAYLMKNIFYIGAILPFPRILMQEIVCLVLFKMHQDTAVLNVFDGRMVLGGRMLLKGTSRYVEARYFALLESLNFSKIYEIPKVPMACQRIPLHSTVIVQMRMKWKEGNHRLEKN